MYAEREFHLWNLIFYSIILPACPNGFYINITCAKGIAKIQRLCNQMQKAKNIKLLKIQILANHI